MIEWLPRTARALSTAIAAAANKWSMKIRVKFRCRPNAHFNAATFAIFEGEKVMHVAGLQTVPPGRWGPIPYGFLGSNGSR